MKVTLALLIALGFSFSASASFWSYNCSTSNGSVVIKRGQTESGVFLKSGSYKEVAKDQWELVDESQSFDIYGGSFGNEPQTAPETAELASYPDGVAYIVSEAILVQVSKSSFNPSQCAPGEEPQGTVAFNQETDVREISFAVKGNPFKDQNGFPHADQNGIVKAKFFCEYYMDGMALSCIK